MHGLCNRYQGLILNSHNRLQLLLVNVVLVITLNQVRNVRHRSFDILRHDVDGLDVVQLRQLEHLGLLLVAVFLDDGARLLGLVFLLAGLDEPDLSGDCEMGHRAVDHSLIQFVSEQVLLDGRGALEGVQGELAHVHDGPNIELVDPVNGLVDTQDRPLAGIARLGRHKPPLDLLLVVLWVFLPVVELALLSIVVDRLVEALQQIIQDILCKTANLFLELH